MDSYNVSVPMKLDAFVLNPDVCNQDARIAPITQPNYTFLRIADFVLQNDTLDHVDVHNAKPATLNQRITKVLGSDDPADLRKNRLGVYLHWIIPQMYRIGATSTSTPDASTDSLSPAEQPAPAPAPVYPNTPNRWLVIRKLNPTAPTTLPNPLPSGCSVPAVDAWILESDTLQMIDDLDDVDLQVDVSPFISSTAANASHPDQTGIDEQAEVFIGKRSAAADWIDNHPTAVNLSLLNSSNHLFPDYQPHNSNVFSMIDTFPYYDARGNEAGTLTDAVADYYVIGWHGQMSNDPFRSGKLHNQVLGNLPLTLRDLDQFDAWLQSKADVNTICHGAMYGVEWHSKWTDETRPKKLPANDFCSQLLEKMPISVGTTTLDALLTYLEAHQEGELDKDIRLLGHLLRTQSDSASGQQAGSDEVQNYNFSRKPGGTNYIMPIDAQNPAAPPSETDIKNLKLLNQAQILYDAASRMLQQKQWETFSLWWQFVTDIDNTSPTTKTKYSTQAAKLDTARGDLSQVLVNQAEAINALKDPANGYLFQAPKAATFQEYNAQRDPTLFVGGLQTSWPVDFLDPLFVRIDPQISTYGTSKGDQLKAYFIDRLPSSIQSTCLALFQEFLVNTPSATTSRAGLGTTPAYEPIYHDQGLVKDPLPGTPWRDRWESTQPWFPLFMEWEIEYFHVDFSNWTLEERTARFHCCKNLRYGLEDDVKYNTSDTRTLSGRILLLPQPSFSLKGQLEQLFSSTPASILDPILSSDKRKELLNNVTTLPFASAPFDGFTDHLITLAQGAHLKPNIRVPATVGTKLEPLQAAYETSQAVGLGVTQIRAIGVESDMTPYGTLVQLGSENPGFKPATHGQFRITKLNIVDKFGQTACAIDPKPTSTGPPPIYPCISDYYEPQMLSTGFPNVVVPQKEPGICEFMQISPCINQPSRLNAAFVKPDTTQPSAYWRPITEWENPVWGWVVVNYVDNGIQFFTQEGDFYCEARIAAPNNPHPTSASATWLPFKPQPKAQTQLDDLILRLTDATSGEQYLKNFINMINSAVPDSASTPSAYSQFVNAVIGKPLALANLGVSLELAGDARASQSTLDDQQNLPQPFTLLEDDGSPQTKQYTFPFKLGDHDRVHDGLIGYFRAYSNPQSHVDKELDTTKFYTSYIKPDGAIVFPISNANGYKYPTLSSFWLDPYQYQDLKKITDEHYIGTAARYEDARNSKLVDNVFGCIMDPFLPVNIYTSILPVKPLSLPNWTWESALRKMTAFFYFGPLMVTDDISPFESKDRKASFTDGGTSAVKLPSLKVAEWTWLQPYYSDPAADPEFSPLNVGQTDSKPRFQKGPYTAIEGYLQMKSAVFSDQE